MHIDPLALDVDLDVNNRALITISPIPRISGSYWGYIRVDAINMIDVIEKALEKNSLPAAQQILKLLCMKRALILFVAMIILSSALFFLLIKLFGNEVDIPVHSVCLYF